MHPPGDMLMTKSIMIKFINIHQVSPLPVIHVRYSGYFIVKAFLSIK